MSTMARLALLAVVMLTAALGALFAPLSMLRAWGCLGALLNPSDTIIEHQHALSEVGVLRPRPKMLPACSTEAAWSLGEEQQAVSRLNISAVLRLTAWGRCHWFWKNEWISSKVEKSRSYGPTRAAQHALTSLGPAAHLVDAGANVGTQLRRLPSAITRLASKATPEMPH